MMPDRDIDSNTTPIGQLAVRASVALLFLWTACHPMPPPGSGDPRLPQAFRTPEKTFATWKKATLAGDRETIRECYWEGLGRSELEAYIHQNLKPEAREFFHNAELIGIKPVSRVEVNFVFQSPGVDMDIRGVMVRTRHGWKVQHW